MYKLCKTEASALRQQRLELALFEAMQTQSYESITVQDLCNRIPVPRKTFYRYFSDKGSALQSMIDHTFMEFEAFCAEHFCGNHITWQQELELFFSFWLERRMLLEVLIKNDFSTLIVTRAVEYALSLSVFSCRSPYSDETMRLYSVRFLISGLISLLLHWSSSGFRETPLEMAQIAISLLEHPLLCK